MPKRATYYIDNHKIEVFKTFFGKEKVLLNGIKVSEKPFKEAAKHQFNIGRNRYQFS